MRNHVSLQATSKEASNIYLLTQVKGAKAGMSNDAAPGKFVTGDPDHQELEFFKKRGQEIKI